MVPKTHLLVKLNSRSYCQNLSWILQYVERAARHLSRKNKGKAALCLLLVCNIFPWLLNHLPDLHKKVFACQELACFAHSLVKKEHTTAAVSRATPGHCPCGMAWEDSGRGVERYKLVLKLSLK